MQKGLGKGLGALLGDTSPLSSAPAAEGSGVTMLPIAKVEAYRKQPRKQFDEASLQDLADSIRRHGILQPLTVRKLSSGYYQIIAGERRWRAARMAGLSEVPVLIIEADDRKAMELAMIENLQREALNPIEEAKAYRSLINELAYSHEELAKAMGKSRPYISNALRLLQLPQEIQTSIENGKLSQGHARALLAVEDTKKQLTIYHQVLTEKWSVRTLEKRLQELPKKQKSKKDIHIKDKEKELEKSLGLPVTLRYHKNHSGTIQIHFSTEEDFNRIINKLI